jgi:hypothetical protein
MATEPGAPVVAPTPAPAATGNLDFQQLQHLWIQAGGAAEWAPTMAAIALGAESRGNPNATNPSGATGLWQIEVPGSSGGYTAEQLKDPLTNAKRAVQLLGDGSGISNWGSGTGDAIGTAIQANGDKPLTTAQAQQYATQGGPQTATLDAAVTTPAKTAAAPPVNDLPATKPYTGPGAYEGFDLSAIPADLQAQVKAAINQYIAKPGLEASTLSSIEQNYGSESWAMSDPQIRTLLVYGAVADLSKDPNMFTDLLQQTNWYKSQSDNQRAYDQLSANNPGQAKAAVEQAHARVVDMANQLGVQLTAAQASHIATTVAQQSVDESGAYSNTSFSDQSLAQAISGEFHASSFAATMSGNAPAGAVTGQSAGGQAVGDAATLYNQFQAISKNYYLGLTPTQISQQVQNYIKAYTGQGDFLSGAEQGFETYAKQVATTNYPALGNLIGTSNAAGATAQTPYTSLAGYRTLIANYTGYQGDPDTIDLSSPQYNWILTGNSPPTPGAPGAAPTPTATPGVLPTYDTVQKVLMQSPAYQTTDMAKNQGWQIGSSILKAYGYNA